MKGFTWKSIFASRNRVVPEEVVWDLKTYRNGQLVDFNIFPPPPKLEIFTELGIRIDTDKTEYPEQCLAFSYIDPKSAVLELGARYGSVSCIINKVLENKQNQVSVEPDMTVWTALEENIQRNDCSVQVFKGFVSRSPRQLLPYGYAATSFGSETSDIQSMTIEELEEQYQLKFDTLVADCEGFLGDFFSENPHLYDQLTTVIFEADYPDKCDYAKLRATLKEYGFREIVSGFQNVFKK